MPRNVHPFAQETDPRFPGGAGKGVCLTMSVWYLIAAAKTTFESEDYRVEYWEWFNENAGEIRRKGNETNDPDTYFDTMRQAGHLELTDTFSAPTDRLAHNLLQVESGPYRLAVFGNESFKMAHAIACYVKPKIRILDVSGGGEFEFDSIIPEAFEWLHANAQENRIDAFGHKKIMSYASGFPKLTVYCFSVVTR
jgi:hypothetical protein